MWTLHRDGPRRADRARLHPADLVQPEGARRHGGRRTGTAWLVEGLGALAADLCGFGAVNYDDAWHYLDATHLYPLVTEEDAGAVSSKLGVVLFLRWLMDTQEPLTLARAPSSSR